MIDTIPAGRASLRVMHREGRGAYFQWVEGGKRGRMCRSPFECFSEWVRECPPPKL